MNFIQSFIHDISNQDTFLQDFMVILKHLLQNHQKIVKKCMKVCSLNRNASTYYYIFFLSCILGSRLYTHTNTYIYTHTHLYLQPTYIIPLYCTVYIGISYVYLFYVHSIIVCLCSLTLADKQNRIFRRKTSYEYSSSPLKNLECSQQNVLSYNKYMFF